MAKVHILETMGGGTRLVYHITVSNGSNIAGISWVNATKNSGVGGTTILPDGDGTGGTVSSAEKTSIVAGSVYEAVDTVGIDQIRTDTAAHANVDLDALHAAKTTEVQALLQARLNTFGYTRT